MTNFDFLTIENRKKRSEETQTLHAGCSKAEPKISSRRRPPSGGAGRPKFNQLEMVTTFIVGGGKVTDWYSRWFCVLIFCNYYECVLSIARKRKNVVAIFSVDLQ